MDEQAFLMNPDKWPQMMLPMCRRKGDLIDEDYCGVIYPNNLRKVYISNMLTPIGKDTKVAEYNSIEELLAEWRVD